MNNRFLALERQVVDQFNVLKTMVLNIEDQLRSQDMQIKKHHGKLRKDLRELGYDRFTIDSQNQQWIEDTKDIDRLTKY